MKYISYLCYRLKKLNPQNGTLSIALQLEFVFFIHLLPMIFILNEILNVDILGSVNELMYSYDVVTRRMLIMPVVFLPLTTTIYAFLSIKKQQINNWISIYEQMDLCIKKRYNRILWVYIFLSFLFFIAGSSSPVWLK